MRILINGETCEVENIWLDKILVEQGYLKPAIATVLNSAIVHKQHRAETRLNEGDQLEVVAPIGGG